MKRLSLKWQVMIVVVAAILILGVSVFFVSEHIITEQTEQVAIDKARSDLDLVYELIDRDLPGEWRKEGTTLYKGHVSLNGNHQLVDSLTRLTGNTVTIFRDGTRIATSVRVGEERALGTEAADYVIEQVLHSKTPYYGNAHVVGEVYQAAYRPLLDEAGDAVGMLYTGASPTVVDETVSIFRRTVILTSCIIGLLSAIGVYIFISRGLLAPIAVVCDQADALVRGDLTEDIPEAYTKRGDEIGVLARAFQEVITGQRKVVASLQAMITRAAQTGEHLLATSEENSATIEEVASSVNEFSQMVSGVHQQGEKMASGANEVKELAGTGRQDMDRTVQSMERIWQSANQTKEAVSQVSREAENMGVVLNLISDVAEQTNLLALNAAIEAARAGEGGRGFAVVADEVRQLAEQTKNAVTDISQMNHSLMSQVVRAVNTIDESENEVVTGQKVLNQTMESFQSIVQHIDEVVESINQVVASSGEMDLTSQEISSASQQQAASMAEIANMAESVANMVTDLQQVIAGFKIRV